MNKVQLDKILALHRRWSTGQENGLIADLHNADLFDAYLVKAYLSRANLSGANLARANLIEASLTRANLSGANLSGADLAGANLIGADLTKTCLQGTNLIGANLSWAKGIVDAGQDLRGFRFIGVDSFEGIRILAGCRWFSLERAERHWKITGNEDALSRVELIAKWAKRLCLPKASIEIFDEKSG